MSTVKNLNCYLEYDEGVMEIVIIDAVIQMGIHAWGSTLNLSLERDGANLLIKHNAAQQSRALDGACTCAKNPIIKPVNGVCPVCNGTPRQ